MRTRRLVLGADEDDVFAWMARHPMSDVDGVVWPGRFQWLAGRLPFDRLATTARVFGMDAYIAACLTRVKGPDGLTPGQRLGAEQVGTRLREAT